jgi:hypothetical protein
MSNPKVRLWSAARVAMVALVIALGIGQVIIGDAIPAANAAPDTASGNNGWGNGSDTTNPGSLSGKGVSQGAPGAGVQQSVSKSNVCSRPGCVGR